MRCLLCHGAIKSLERYENHLHEEHEVSHAGDLVIAVTFLDEEEQEVIIDRVEERKKVFTEDGKLNKTSNVSEFYNVKYNQELDTNNSRTVFKEICQKKGGSEKDKSGFLSSINDIKYIIGQNQEFDTEYGSLMEKLLDAESVLSSNVTLDEEAQNKHINDLVKKIQEDDENEDMDVSFISSTTEAEEDTDEIPSNISITNITSVNNANTDLECKLCFTTLGSTKSLRRHMKSVHKRDRRLINDNSSPTFPCLFCQKSTLTENLLKIHLRQHNGGHNVCIRCDKKFNGTNNYDLIMSHQCLKLQSVEHSAHNNKNHIMIVKQEIVNEEDFAITNPVDNNMMLDYDQRLIIDQDNDQGLDITQLMSIEMKGEVAKNDALGEPELDQELSQSVLLVKQEIMVDDSGENEEFENTYEYMSSNINNDTIDNNTEKQNSFICRLCYTGFSNRANLGRHERTIHKDDQTELGMSFGFEDLVYSCSICNLKFITENILVNHQRLQHRLNVQNKTKTHQEKTNECKLCYKMFTQSRNLNQHIKKVHREEQQYLDLVLSEEEKKYNCSNCDKKFVTENMLNSHKDIHREKNHKCEGCSLKFFSLSGLRKHMKKVHRELLSDETYCKLCRINFKSCEGLSFHKMKIHGNELNVFEKELTDLDLIHKCLYCDKKYATENTANNHMKRKHYKIYQKCQKKINKTTKKKEDLRFCKLCNVTYKKPEFLKQHKKKIHMGELDAFSRDIMPKELKCMCPTCKQMFFSEETVNFHRRKVHSYHAEAEGFCQLCQIAFKRKSYYESHVKAVHKSDIEMKALETNLEDSILTNNCNYCEKSFLNENTLKYHIRYGHKSQRDDEVSFCQLCDVSFKRRGSFDIHIKNIHKSDIEREALENKMVGYSLNSKCNHCEKSFFNENTLQYHVRNMHKGLSRIEDATCKYCNKLFQAGKYRNKSLNQHMKKVHNIDKSSNEDNGESFEAVDVMKNFMALFNQS